jgi:matrixin
MKRAVLSFLSIILGLLAIGAAQRDWVRERTATPGASREESASGSVGVLPANDRDEENSRAAVRSRLRRSEQGTYIADILRERDSSLARWPDRHGKPLRVWVEPTSNIPDFTDAYVEEVRAAFEDWDALELPVRFEFVRDSAKADVHVSWLDHFEQPISGRTKWARDDDWWITDADIVLAVHHHQGEVLDLDAMKAMALHEIGHLLGLDHTKDSGCIMAPKVRVRGLSPADIATARLLYTLPPGAVR